jgi:hypothetical protein
MEVLIDASTRDICIADSNGSGLTDLYDLSSLWSYHAVVNDQVGDVYIADNNDDILKSVNGATPTTFLVNVCGNNPMTGTGSGYTLQGMAFTPDGSKGAWFCQDNAAYPHGNGYISFWDGLIVNTIYTAQGATSPPVNDVNSVRSMALSADGSTLVYETTDESTSAYAGDSGATHTMLYEIATNVVTATGAATVLDAGSGNNIGAYDGFGNALAFTNGGADVVYDVSTDNAATNSIWKVPVNGSGSPAQLVAPSGSDSWSVVGADDSAGNGFACQKENSSYITLQLRLCASDGTPGTTLPLPNTASGESPVGYSSTR